jgi:hypothetical protein
VGLLIISSQEMIDIDEEDMLNNVEDMNQQPEKENSDLDNLMAMLAFSENPNIEEESSLFFSREKTVEAIPSIDSNVKSNIEKTQTLYGNLRSNVEAKPSSYGNVRSNVEVKLT